MKAINVFENSSVKKFFATEKAQSLMARHLENKELKLFQKNYVQDEEYNYLWEELSPAEVAGNRLDIYYMMVGVQPGMWVFAPSMVGKNFLIDGEDYTIEKDQEHYERYVLKHISYVPEQERWGHIEDFVIKNKSLGPIAA